MSTTEPLVAEKHTYDPIALTESFASAADKSAKLLGDFLARQAVTGPSPVTDEFGLTKAFLEVAAKMLSNPVRLAETQMNLWWDYSALWQSSMLRFIGQAPAPVAEPAKGDKRFRHEDWQEHFLFDYVKQSYLLTARWLHDAVANVEGLDEKTQKKVDFFTRQYIDAVAPSNFALTNPEVFRETIATGGQNLVKGLNNLLDDIERGHGKLRISMTDSKAFELGVNIATTPGKVVFQNDLMQLIQYEPTTAKVYKRPLLIMPPWINKYYIAVSPFS
jgi:polyhydroxyalkanoate synthase subunit PhaC